MSHELNTNIPRPPRFIGDPKNPVADIRAQAEWLWDLYRKGFLEGEIQQTGDLGDSLEDQFPILFNLGSLTGTGADILPYMTDADSWAVTTLTPFARTLLNDADAAAMLTTLGASTFTAEECQDTVATMLQEGANIGLVYDDGANQLTVKVELSATDRLVGRSTAGAGDAEEITCTAAGRAILDDATAAAQKATLGVTNTLVVDATQTGNGAGVETDAFSHTVAANTLAINGQSLTFDAGGTFAATASVDKRIRVKFGGTTIFDTGAIAVTAASAWNLNGRIIRTGAATQKCIISYTSSYAGFPATAAYIATAIDLTSDQTLKLTLQATNANDVVAEAYTEQWHPIT